MNNILLLLVMMIAAPAFANTSLTDSYAQPPQILTGGIQVTTEAEPWTASTDRAMSPVEASLVDAPAEVVIANTMLPSSEGVKVSTILAAATMLLLASMTGAFVLAVRA